MVDIAARPVGSAGQQHRESEYQERHDSRQKIPSGVQLQLADGGRSDVDPQPHRWRFIRFITARKKRIWSWPEAFEDGDFDGNYWPTIGATCNVVQISHYRGVDFNLREDTTGHQHQIGNHQNFRLDEMFEDATLEVVVTGEERELDHHWSRGEYSHLDTDTLTVTISAWAIDGSQNGIFKMGLARYLNDYNPVNSNITAIPQRVGYRHVSIYQRQEHVA